MILELVGERLDISLVVEVIGVNCSVTNKLQSELLTLRGEFDSYICSTGNVAPPRSRRILWWRLGVEVW